VLLLRRRRPPLRPGTAVRPCPLARCPTSCHPRKHPPPLFEALLWRGCSRVPFVPVLPMFCLPSFVRCPGKLDLPETCAPRVTRKGGAVETIIPVCAEPATASAAYAPPAQGTQEVRCFPDGAAGHACSVVVEKENKTEKGTQKRREKKKKKKKRGGGGGSTKKKKET